MIGSEPGKTYLTTVGQQTVITNLKKSTWNCHEDNKNSQTDCINKFYSKKLGCILPWIKVVDDFTKTICNGTEKFKEFRSLSMFIHEGKTNDELEREGKFFLFLLNVIYVCSVEFSFSSFFRLI